MRVCGKTSIKVIYLTNLMFLVSQLFQETCGGTLAQFLLDHVLQQQIVSTSKMTLLYTLPIL